MERLTKRTPAGVGVLVDCGEKPRCVGCIGPCVAQDKANTRLAAYEDTGMEPEEINALREFCESTTTTGLHHIYELVQAEREGRLVVTPPAPKVTMDPALVAGQITDKTLQALERMGDRVHRGEAACGI